MRSILTLCDIVRIDHFRGFESYWEIPADAETAVTGHWRAGPATHRFAALRAVFPPPTRTATRAHQPGALKIIAEDLGIITKVTALRTRLGLPGMRILQFAFDGHADNLYLPHNFETNTVVTPARMTTTRRSAGGTDSHRTNRITSGAISASTASRSIGR